VIEQIAAPRYVVKAVFCKQDCLGPLFGQTCLVGLKERTTVKRPKWLWDSRVTKSDKQRKARRQTDQRMKQQDAQKKQRDEAEKKK
jgi:hypothetical protein